MKRDLPVLAACAALVLAVPISLPAAETQPPALVAASSPVLAGLNDLVWAQDRYAAIGSDGRVLTSMDGRIWKWGRQSADAPGWVSIAASPQRWVAVAADGRILASPTGQSWQLLQPPPLAGHALNRVRWTGDHFVVVGARGFVATSRDGTLWKAEPVVTAEDLHGVCGARGTTIAVGTHDTLAMSEPGKAWSAGKVLGTVDAAEATWMSIACGGHGYAAAGRLGMHGQGALAASGDGRTWTTRIFDPGYMWHFPEFRAVDWTGVRFLAAGGSLLRSGDDGRWAHSRLDLPWMRLIAGHGDAAVAIGSQGALLASDDGVAWSLATALDMTDAATLTASGFVAAPQWLAQQHKSRWTFRAPPVPLPSKEALHGIRFGLGPSLGHSEQAVMPDGRFVIGTTVTAGFRECVALARFLPDGRADPDALAPEAARLCLRDVDLELIGLRTQPPDGVLVLAKVKSPPPPQAPPRWSHLMRWKADDARAPVAMLARIREDGRRDAAFGSDGWIRWSANDGFESIHGVSVQPDGAIVVAANVFDQHLFGDPRREVAVLRYDPDGKADRGFADDSRAEIHAGKLGTDSAVGNPAIATDGGLRIGGHRDMGAGDDWGEPFVVALHPDGRLDRSFGRDGTAIPKLPRRFVLYGVQTAPDGGLLLVGNLAADAKMHALARLLPSGLVDTGYGNAGLAELGRFHFAGGLAVASDGSALVLDLVQRASDGRYVLRIYRRTPQGDPDSALDRTGNVDLASVRCAFGRGALTALPDGAMLVSGPLFCAPPVPTQIVAMRVGADGAIDRRFGTPIGEGKPEIDLAAAAAASGPGATSVERSATMPGFADVHDLVWSGAQFVAVGRNGLVATSPDGAQWSLQRWREGQPALKSVAYGAGKYVALTDRGVQTSTDARTWSEPRSLAPSNVRLHRIAWIDDQFIALGDLGFLATSPDAVAWTRRDAGSKERLLGVAKGGARIAVVGEHNTVTVSDDGVIWRAASIMKPPEKPTDFQSTVLRWTSVAWNGRVFAAVADGAFNGAMATSADGILWETRFFPGALADVAWGRDRFVAVGADIVVSPDGSELTFLRARAPGTGYSIGSSRIATNGVVFVATGRNEVYVSVDGKTWRGGSVPAFGWPPDFATVPVTAVPTSPASEARIIARDEQSRALTYAFQLFGALGIFGYPFLQYFAIRTTQGIWRWFAYAPLLMVAAVLVFTVYAYLQHSNLWWLIAALLLPLVWICMIVLLVANAGWKRYRNSRAVAKGGTAAVGAAGGPGT